MNFLILISKLPVRLEHIFVRLLETLEIHGVGGHLVALRRTQVAPFLEADSQTIEDCEIQPLVTSISKVMPIRSIDLAERNELSFGRALTKSEFSGPGIAITPDGEVAAIIENRDYGAQPLAVFNS